MVKIVYDPQIFVSQSVYFTIAHLPRLSMLSDYNVRKCVIWQVNSRNWICVLSV